MKPRQIPTRSPSNLFDLNEQTIVRAAHFYAEQGWPVLPLRPREKLPLTEHGLLDASTDYEQIHNWWHIWPNANVGLRTGDVFDVLDIDGSMDSTAFESFKAIAPEDYSHAGPISNTGRGFHLLFAASGTRNSAGKLTGLDVRGYNGYIVAPPSIHPNGHRYQWFRPASTTDLPEWPEWLDPLTRPPSIVPFQRDTSGQVPILEVFELWEPDHPLKQIGPRYHTTCIFHDDDTPSLVIYPDTNSFYCFGCNAWGDALNLTHYIKTGRLRDNDPS